MPKIKTHKVTAKRFKLSATGKILHIPGGGKGGKVHFRRKKSQATRALFDNTVPIETRGDKKRILRLAPYLNKKKRS